ncbi:hypothetical protein GTZ99_12430 [Novosphingobium sp. FSY-8]|uniref:Rho termination factor-like protein n=1 Tax=Novosphingobium ovatum TaxID=1908523 RepID=A0ABW9XFP4_9SPHN|nr:hypothetical protein [Novosphingobium ovatum]NBC37357.1 hypothetical protein [Novosphingobium ovatum]
MTLVRNISTGSRGVWHGGKLVMVEVGASAMADDFAPEWFEVIDADDTADAAPELAKLTVAQLKDFAAHEGIDLGEETKKADILAAIELALEARNAAN